MRTRITDKDLEAVVSRINRIMGNSELTHTLLIDARDGSKRYRANVGNCHLDYAYGGVRLVQTVNEGGGIKVISCAGYTTKRELYNEMQSFILGLNTRKAG